MKAPWTWILGKTHPVYHGLVLAIALYVATMVTLIFKLLSK